MRKVEETKKRLSQLRLLLRWHVQFFKHGFFRSLQYSCSNSSFSWILLQVKDCLSNIIPIFGFTGQPSFRTRRVKIFPHGFYPFFSSSISPKTNLTTRFLRTKLWPFSGAHTIRASWGCKNGGATGGRPIFDWKSFIDEHIFLDIRQLT